MTNKNIILTILGLISALLLFFGLKYVGNLVMTDIQQRNAINTIIKAKEEVKKCEAIINANHQKAEEARQVLQYIQGTGVIESFNQLPANEQKLGAERTLTGGPNQS